MNRACRDLVCEAAESCEDFLAMAVEASDSGNLESAQAALDWAGFASACAFSVVESAA